MINMLTALKTMSETSANKLRQRLVLGSICLILVLIFYVALFGFDNMALNHPETEVKPQKIETAAAQLPTQTVWAHQIGSENKALKKQLEDLQKQMALNKAEQIKMLSSLKSNKESNFQNFDKALKSLKEDVDRAINNAPGTNDVKHKMNSSNSNMLGKGFFGTNDTNKTMPEQQVNIFKAQLNLAQRLTGKNTSRNMIPAGTIAKATLLGGVDASTSVNSSSDPRPVLLELTRDGSLPRGFWSDISHCRIIGAATGEISSERVYMRLETLSCVDRKTGNITENTVSGYVAGEDGKAGVRGHVVLRDAALVARSVIGGVLGGVSKGITQLSTPDSGYNPFTGNVTQNKSDLLLNAGGEGVGNALDRYAKYNIERAEKLQPVIQVSSGRSVDVVFTKGCQFKKNGDVSSYGRTKTNSVSHGKTLNTSLFSGQS